MVKHHRRWITAGVGFLGVCALTQVGGCGGHEKESRQASAPIYRSPQRSGAQASPQGQVGAERGTTATAVTAAEAELLAANAYIYAYPLVVMDVTRQVMTAASRPDVRSLRAPINQIISAPSFPSAEFKDVVRPNFDTLYTSAWMDLNAEPLVLTVPEMGDRYYLLPVLDAWTNVVASPGTRTSGSRGGVFAITGPAFTGQALEGMQVIRVPTRYAWLVGRIAAKPGADEKAVNELQSQIKLVPLSRYADDRFRTVATSVDKRVDTKTPPPKQVAQMSAQQFFDRFGALTKDNPPSGADIPILASLARIGVVPGRSFDASPLGPDIRAAIDRGIVRGQRTLEEQTALAMSKPGWVTFGSNLGNYGTDYMTRGVVALGGLGANLTADAIYPMAAQDSKGRPLDGHHRYVVRFNQPPPVKGFWSLTPYDDQGHAVKNDIDRHSIGSEHELTRAPDGAISIYMQADQPNDERSRANWLPVPRGPFNVTLRLYSPEPQVGSGAWKPPVIERVD